MYCRAPDGSCLLSCSNDNIMRLYNLPGQLYSDPGSTEDLPEMVCVIMLYVAMQGVSMAPQVC